MTTKKAKSDVWQYFIKESASSARCALCTKLLKHGGNTTNLHNHFKNMHKLHTATKSPPKQTPLKQQKLLTANTAEATCSTSSFNPVQERKEQSLDNSSDIDDPIIFENYISDTDSESQNIPPAINCFKLGNKRKV